MKTNILLIVPVLFPIIMALLTLVIKERFKDRSFRQMYVGAVLVINFVLTLIAVVTGGSLVVLQLTETLPIYLKVDGLTILFTMIVSVMWLLAGIFSFEYMKHEDNNEGYYLFYLLSLGVLIGLGMAGNFMTMYMFYEGMTLLTLSLIHISEPTRPY